MSNFVIGLLIALGSGTWVYAKFLNRSGNNTRQSLTASGVAAVVIFIVVFSILSMIMK